MGEINFVGGENNSYNQYPNNFNQGQGFRQSQGMYRPQPMQNQRPRQEERQPTLQETMLQYMAKNDQRMKLVESQLTNIQSLLSQR